MASMTPDLNELRAFCVAADLGIDVIKEPGAAIRILEPDVGTALGEAGETALAFARYAVA